MSAFKKITNSYSNFESWFYEKFIAAASLEVKFNLIDSTLDGLSPQARILDVGCGGGQVLEKLILESRFSGSFIGVDNSPFQTELAVKRLTPHQSRVQIKRASAQELPFADGDFDLVYSLACLKHWPNINLGLKEVYRVLKPGGELILTELEQASTLSDITDFINFWKASKPLKYLFKIFLAKPYLEKIVRRSISATDVTAELKKLGMIDFTVEKFLQSPAFTIRIRK